MEGFVMPETIKCDHCGNPRSSDLKTNCPSCKSKLYPMGGGYLYPNEGMTFIFTVIMISLIILIAFFFGIYYAATYVFV
jgi:hypothetical protein